MSGNIIKYYGTKPEQFAPCDCELTIESAPISMHPTFCSMRNKRSRRRAIKKLKRRGITHFARPVTLVNRH